MAAGFLEKYGPVALITGASSGIGEQYARLLAAKGFDLLITARRESLLSDLAEELRRQFGIKVDVYACDLSSVEQVSGLISFAKERPLGLIVSNAGFGAKGDFLNHDKQQMDAMYQINSLTPSTLAFELLPVLVKQQRGGMIFTGSIEGDLPFPYSAPYAASKAFLHSLVGSLWLEMKPYDVDVLLLAPGSTDTNAPISQGISRDQLVGVMQPEDVAGQALKKLGKQPYFIPGLHNRFFITLLRYLPRSLVLRMTGAGMKKAIEDSKNSTA